MKTVDADMYLTGSILHRHKQSMALNGQTPNQKLQAYKLFHQPSTKQWC
ncbi:MAG: hypothetical protein RIS97_454 [Pseudomonadota bacterium]|jgi:hypothetical protein